VFKIIITCKENHDLLHESDPIYESRIEAMRSDAYNEYYDTPVKKEIVPVGKYFRGAIFEKESQVKVYGPTDLQDTRSSVDSILDAAMSEGGEQELYRKEIWEVLS